MAAKQPLLPSCRSSYCTTQAGPAHRHAQRAARHPRLVVVERRPHNVHRAAVLHRDGRMAAWQGAISCVMVGLWHAVPHRRRHRRRRHRRPAGLGCGMRCTTAAAQAPPPQPQACGAWEGPRLIPIAAGTAASAQHKECKLAFTSTAPPSCPQLRSNAELVTDRLAPSSSSTAPPPAGGGCGRQGTAGMSQVGRWKACRHGRGMGSLRLKETCRRESRCMCAQSSQLAPCPAEQPSRLQTAPGQAAPPGSQAR